jgi:hypothetical protein
MKLKYLLLVLVFLWANNTSTAFNNDPCPNPSESGFVQIPSVTSAMHTVLISVTGNCTQQNGSCDMSSYGVSTRVFGNTVSGWSPHQISNTGNGGSKNLYNSTISWTSNIEDGFLTIEVTATNNGQIIDQTTITMECEDNMSESCCDLPPYGCAETTEYICNQMGGIFSPTFSCVWFRNRYLCASPPNLASGSGGGGGGMVAKNNPAEPIKALNYKRLDVAVWSNGNELLLNIEIPNSGQLNIQIYNLAGQSVYEQSSKVSKGHYSRNLPLSNQLSPGMYFININIEGQQLTKKFILSR